MTQLVWFDSIGLGMFSSYVYTLGKLETIPPLQSGAEHKQLPDILWPEGRSENPPQDHRDSDSWYLSTASK